MAAAAYRHEELQKTPRGYRVRSVKRGSHVVRVAFPPGPRRKGSGKVVEILHPKAEKQNPSCEVSKKAKANPGELLIFGNPGVASAKRATRDRAKRIRAARLNPGGTKNHKANCKCFACKHKRGENPKRSTQRRRRHDRRNPVARKRVRNQSDTRQAVKLFQSFHGRDPKDIVEKHVSAEVRKDYAALGDLEHLLVVTPLGQTVKFNFHGDGVKLASSPDGKQLYCLGGNQNLTQCLTPDSLEKDFVDLGEGAEVQYLARKIHGNFEPISYFHKFGEKTGARPQLMYDKLKRQIFFVGGEYFINGKQGVSPGIEN